MALSSKRKGSAGAHPLLRSVALDTNALLYIGKFRIDVFREILDSMGRVKFVIPFKVIEELKALAGKNASLRKQARIAFALLAKHKAKKVRTQALHADDALLELGEKGAVIVTNDRALKERLKEKHAQCMFLRKKKFLAVME